MSKTKILPTTNGHLYKIDPRAIVIEPNYNVRFSLGDLKELEDSIIKNGVEVPLMVRRHPELKDRFILIRGHRRHQACLNILERDNGLDLRVPCQITKPMSELDLLIDLHTSNTGKPLTVLETAELVKRISKYNLTPAEIAQKLSKSKSFVSNMLQLHAAPEKIKKLISDGTISSTLVLELFRKEKNFDELLSKINNVQKENQPVSADKNVTESEDTNTGELGNFQQPAKITKKSIAKAEKKHPSLMLVKKAIKQNIKSEAPKMIKPEARELYGFILGLINGELTAQEIEDRLFDNGEIKFESQESDHAGEISRHETESDMPNHEINSNEEEVLP